MNGSFQRWRPEEKKEIPIGYLVNAFGKTQDRVDQFFAAGGPLARVVGPGYTPRPAQINLAQIVMRTLQQRHVLLAEAETGTGKSFAGLVPAILWAVENDRTILVSTATIALQDQYCRKDLPMLEQAFASMGIEFRWAKAQGRSNYYCLESKGCDLPEFWDYQEQINDWLLSTETGDFNELAFDIKHQRLGLLYEGNRADPEDCPGARKCPSGEQCYFFRARQAHEGAHVIVVNHALLAINERCDRQILPAYHALIVDEAHQLERYVRGAWEVTLSPRRCYKLGAKLAKLECDGQEVLDQVGKRLVEVFDEYLRPYGDTPTVDWLAKRWPADWDTWVREVTPQLQHIVDNLCGLADVVPKAAPLAISITELGQDLHKVTAENAAAKWFERDRKKRPQLKLSPVDVSEETRRFYAVPTVLTSATLATGESYEFAKLELGIQSALEMPPLASPFNWRKHCLYVFPRRGTLTEDDLKARRGETSRQAAQRWATRIAGPIKQMLAASSGRAFVLFTSKAAMEETYDLVAPHCREQGWEVLLQGQYSKGETVARFKAGCSPVLFATSSFWEGVDVQGSQLSLVIIDKLPWPNPSNPIERAKSEIHGFRKYNIPVCVRTLKQGVGRLIRSETDRGCVCILDPRVHKYRREIVGMLPGDALAGLDRTGPVKITEFLDGAGVGRRGPASSLEEWAARGLRHLSNNDGDRAREENGVGFSAADTETGNSLAAQLVDGLTDRQWALSTSMLRRYWRQIGHPPEPTIDEMIDALEDEEAAA